MRRIFIVFLFLLFLYGNISSLRSQVQNPISDKQGGICFRVDDNQSKEHYSEYAAIFDKYNYKACFSLNIKWLLIYKPAVIDTLLKMQHNGHEIMDHTPNHRTQYLTNISDTSFYSGRSGVDHISNDTVCLRWESVKRDSYNDEGLIDINGNNVISMNNGEFYNVDAVYIYAIYLPIMNKIFRVGNVKNSVRTDPDTLAITSFWDEQINIGTFYGLQYDKIGLVDVKMADSAIYLLAELTHITFEQAKLNFPKTWIQPGWPTPRFYREEIKRIIESNFGYTGAATYPNRAFKCYNEYNDSDDKQFGVQWEDFNEDEWTLQQNKSIIADRIARHYVSIGNSHFNYTLLPGGWTGYIGRVDSLLIWCKENNIPVFTQSKWTDILYKTPQDPSINIFPNLNIDLDKNHIPDGFYTKSSGYTDGFFDTSSGVPESNNRSFRINRIGSICFINDLGGLEKDTNDFHIWTKGPSGSIITVHFIFQELNQTNTFTFPASTAEWTKYDLSQSTNGKTILVVPRNASYVDIRISCTTYQGDWVSVSGMSLKKKIPGSIITGRKYHDLNNDGILNAGEPGISGWRIDLNGKYITSTYTDVNGYYRFSGLDSGTYIVTEERRNGWFNTQPSTGEYHIELQLNVTSDNIDFGNAITIPRLKIPLSFYNADKSAVRDIYWGIRTGASYGIWGVDPSATSVDSAEGENELPPPMSGTFDIRFINLDHSPNYFGNGSWVDIRNFFSSSQCDTYKLSFQSGPTGYPVTFKWSKEIINQSFGGVVRIEKSLGKWVDMKLVDSLVIKKGNTRALHIISENPTIPILYNKGWNIISLPTMVVDARRTVLFPTSTSRLYKYDHSFGYVASETLDVGNGYWIKFPSVIPPITIDGIDVSSISVNVFKGWNLVGSLTNSVSVSSIESVPPGIIVGGFFGYDSSYYPADTLKPFMGYWVKAEQDGQLIINSSSQPISANRIRIIPTSELPPPPPGEAISAIQAIPKEYTLEEAFPNPFNPNTTIRYQLPEESRVTLKVYNTLGQVVIALTDEVQEAGIKSVDWHASNIASGVYFYRLEAISVSDPNKAFTQVKKMLLIK